MFQRNTVEFFQFIGIVAFFAIQGAATARAGKFGIDAEIQFALIAAAFAAVPLAFIKLSRKYVGKIDAAVSVENQKGLERMTLGCLIAFSAWPITVFISNKLATPIFLIGLVIGVTGWFKLGKKNEKNNIPNK